MEIRLTNRALKALQKRGIDLMQGGADFAVLDNQVALIFEGTRHLPDPPTQEAVEEYHDGLTPGESMAVLTGAINAAMGVKPEATGGTVAGTKSAEAPEGGEE